MKKIISLVVALVLAIATYTDAKTYGSGSKTRSSSPSRSSPSRSYSPPKSSTPKSTPSYRPKSYDSGARNDAQKESSKKSYETSKPTPLPTYKTSTGQSKPIDTGSPQVSKIRSTDYKSRPVRIRNYYGSRYNDYASRPAPMFNDAMNAVFWFWLLDQATEDRASYAYNHKAEMDPARYQQMVNNDAKLQAMVQELEKQNLAKDPNWTPKGMDADLQYSDDYVKAVQESSGPSLGTIFKWVLLVFLIPTVLAGLIWVGVCFVRWWKQ